MPDYDLTTQTTQYVELGGHTFPLAEAQRVLAALLDGYQYAPGERELAWILVQMTAAQVEGDYLCRGPRWPEVRERLAALVTAGGPFFVFSGSGQEWEIGGALDCIGVYATRAEAEAQARIDGPPERDYWSHIAAPKNGDLEIIWAHDLPTKYSDSARRAQRDPLPGRCTPEADLVRRHMRDAAIGSARRYWSMMLPEEREPLVALHAAFEAWALEQVIDDHP